MVQKMSKITFTEEEVKSLEVVRDMLCAKWDEANFLSMAYDLLRPAYFAVDELVDEIICNQNSLDN